MLPAPPRRAHHPQGQPGPRRRQTPVLSGPVTPAALVSKDHHSLWLNSAALALAGGDLEVEGGLVARDRDGEPTGVLEASIAAVGRTVMKEEVNR